MDECTHLIRDYLCKNPTAINWGYYVMSEDDLSQALHQLKSFDRPDMYAILKDKIVIIEHFEFDASTDLENADLHLSPLNKNEITVYGKF